jgi:hypothetical protein
MVSSQETHQEPEGFEESQVVIRKRQKTPKPEMDEISDDDFDLKRNGVGGSNALLYGP